VLFETNVRGGASPKYCTGSASTSIPSIAAAVLGFQEATKNVCIGRVSINKDYFS